MIENKTYMKIIFKIFFENYLFKIFFNVMIQQKCVVNLFSVFLIFFLNDLCL